MSTVATARAYGSCRCCRICGCCWIVGTSGTDWALAAIAPHARMKVDAVSIKTCFCIVRLSSNPLHSTPPDRHWILAPRHRRNGSLARGEVPSQGLAYCCDIMRRGSHRCSGPVSTFDYMFWPYAYDDVCCGALP